MIKIAVNVNIYRSFSKKQQICIFEYASHFLLFCPMKTQFILSYYPSMTNLIKVIADIKFFLK